MGWLSCLFTEGEGPIIKSSRQPPQPSPPIASSGNVVRGETVESALNACCVFAVSSDPSDCTILVHGGSGALASASGSHRTSLLLDLVAANSACFAKLSASSTKLAPSALLAYVGPSGLFWLACEHAVSQGDAAGHMAVAHPDGHVLVIKACSWGAASMGVIVEWQQSPSEVKPRSRNHSQLQLVGQQQVTASSRELEMQRAHEVLNDERFPAAIT